jgi:hypothetical protein
MAGLEYPTGQADVAPWALSIEGAILSGWLLTQINDDGGGVVVIPS